MQRSGQSRNQHLGAACIASPRETKRSRDLAVTSKRALEKDRVLAEIPPQVVGVNRMISRSPYC